MRLYLLLTCSISIVFDKQTEELVVSFVGFTAVTLEIVTAPTSTTETRSPSNWSPRTLEGQRQKIALELLRGTWLPAFNWCFVCAFSVQHQKGKF
jgi:hypothetical protein